MKTYLYIVFTLMLCSFWACKKDNDPTIEDNFLNYKIPDVPPTRNHIIGAMYTNLTVYRNKVKTTAPNTFFNYEKNLSYRTPTIVDTPTVGQYNVSTTGVLAATIMRQHIDFAVKAKIDYFIFNISSASKALTTYRADSTLIKNFLDAPNSSTMSFALQYNFTPSQFSNAVTTPIEGIPANLENFYKDFTRLASFLNKTNYMKVNGKYVLLINNAFNLAANNNATVYAEIRKRMLALGFDLYIVGMQQSFTPPQRFFNRIVNCVDAMYQSLMVQAGSTPDRVYLFPQVSDQNFSYWKESLKKDNIDFIPSVSPSYNFNIATASSINMNIEKGDGSFYKMFCNVAKRNAPDNGMIFIETFNDWNSDSQIEPANRYGETYLNITREQFKLSN